MNEDEEFVQKHGWNKEYSKSKQKPYYYHKDTRRSVWTLEEAKAKSLEGSSKKRERPSESSSSSSSSSESLKRKKTATDTGEGKDGEESTKESKDSKEGVRVAIIVPFRDLDPLQARSSHLSRFIPHMVSFLSSIESVTSFHVFIIEQSNDDRKFNRGKLLNIGFKYITEKFPRQFNSFIFHDVDLLPQQPLASWYGKFPSTPIHIARCWARYNDSSKYFGGIVAFSERDFVDIDGFPNTYWGWGGEDDELRERVDEKRLRVIGPPKDLANAVVDMEDMDLSTKLALLKKKSEWKCNVKWEARDEYKKYRQRQKEIPWWGLHGVKFTLKEEKELDKFATKITVDVGFNFNHDGSEHWANRKTDWK